MRRWAEAKGLGPHEWAFNGRDELLTVKQMSPETGEHVVGEGRDSHQVRQQSSGILSITCLWCCHESTTHSCRMQCLGVALTVPLRSRGPVRRSGGFPGGHARRCCDTRGQGGPAGETGIQGRPDGQYRIQMLGVISCLILIPLYAVLPPFASRNILFCMYGGYGRYVIWGMGCVTWLDHSPPSSGA